MNAVSGSSSSVGMIHSSGNFARMSDFDSPTTPPAGMPGFAAVHMVKLW